MANKVELDVNWWTKNAPDSVTDGEVKKALLEVSKAKANLEKSGDQNSFFKALEKLKAGIGKDEQTAKKEKDKEALTLLADLKKAADAQRGETDGHLTPKGDGKVSGLSTASGVAVPAPKGGGAGAMASAAGAIGMAGGGAEAKDSGGGISVVTIINGLDKAWAIIKDNKADSSAKSSFCQAVPGNIPFNELYGWKQESTTWNYGVENLYGVKTVDIQFQLDYQWNGRTDRAAGLFLNNYNVWCKSLDVLWGYTVNVDATVTGNPFNSGTREAPVGAIPLLISAQVKTVLRSLTPSWKITCHGNKQRDVA